MNYKMLIGLLISGASATPEFCLQQIQDTNDDAKNHDLDNNDNISPDGKWLVYDTRTDHWGIGGGLTIERVNIGTKETEVLFEVSNKHK